MYGQIRRQAIRSAVNPLDVSTVVSILPKHIVEKKHTLQPSVFELLPGTYDKPSLLVVGTSSWWRELDPHQPLIEIPTSSVLIADSIVNDYCNGLLMCNMGDTMPGLFSIPGKITHEQLKGEYKPLIEKANNNQRRWFQALVKLADVMWSRTQGNPLSIPEDARLGARELGLNNKEWMKDSISYEMIKCIACGMLRNTDFPICPHCKAVVDPEKAKALNLAFAK